MSKKFIIDSSVIVKWLNTTDEEYIEIVNKILSDALCGQSELLAPELSKYEVSNVLLKGKQLNPQDAYLSIATLYSLPIAFISESEEVAKDTFSLAYEYSITYYDASFLSLAKQYNATLITENMKHQGKTHSIHVISLKDY